MSAIGYAVSDTMVLARRSLLRIPRQPDLLVGFTIQPVMFVLLFVYVFGGAIQTPGYDYVDFLIPGIIVQTLAFGGFVTALGLSDDLRKGLIDRFRSLPMARAARARRPDARRRRDATALARGDDRRRARRRLPLPTRRPWRSLAGIGLMLLLGYAFSWIFAFMALIVVLARGGPVDRLHPDLPAHLRLVGVRAGRLDARLAAGVRRRQPVHAWPSTRCGRSGSARRPATRSGARSPGAWG